MFYLPQDETLLVSAPWTGDPPPGNQTNLSRIIWSTRTSHVIYLSDAACPALHIWNDTTVLMPGQAWPATWGH